MNLASPRREAPRQHTPAHPLDLHTALSLALSAAGQSGALWGMGLRQPGLIDLDTYILIYRARGDLGLGEPLVGSGLS